MTQIDRAQVVKSLLSLMWKKQKKKIKCFDAENHYSPKSIEGWVSDRKLCNLNDN